MTARMLRSRRLLSFCALRQAAAQPSQSLAASTQLTLTDMMEECTATTTHSNCSHVRANQLKPLVVLAEALKPVLRANSVPP